MPMLFPQQFKQEIFHPFTSTSKHKLNHLNQHFKPSLQVTNKKPTKIRETIQKYRKIGNLRLELGNHLPSVNRALKILKPAIGLHPYGVVRVMIQRVQGFFHSVLQLHLSLPVSVKPIDWLIDMRQTTNCMYTMNCD